MTDPALLPALREALKQNEIGNASPYCLSYACKGVSGASFGVFQGDTNVNHTARATLLQILQAARLPAAAITRVIAAVSQACPQGSPLSPGDAKAVDAAIDCPDGRALTDAMDNTLLQVVLCELDRCLAAAATRNQTLAPAAQLYIALWVNMTGAPDTLCKWLAGTQEVGLAPPAGPVVSAQNLEGYLQANTYFRLHPHNFVHMQESVGAALALLPPPEQAGNA